MGQLPFLDIAVVVVYLVGTTLLGLWFAGGQSDTRKYFLGDRNIHWLLVLVSIVATETSTVTFLSVPTLSYREGGNFAFLQLALGYILGRLLVAWFLLPQFFRGEAFTAYQLLREKFDRRVQRVASGLFLLTRSVADGLRLYLTALLLQQFTGWNMSVSILAMASVTIVYTFLGGMQAVIWTDLIQFIVYVAGALFAGVVILQLIPGGWDEYVFFGRELDKFHVFDLTWDQTSAYTLWAGLIGGTFVSMASHGVDQMMVQRYLCATSVGKARLALVTSGFVVFAQFALFLGIGVGLYALRGAGILDAPEGMPNDQVFGVFIVDLLPTGIRGLVVAAVLAVGMSTLASSLNSSASALVADFYRPMRPNRDESHYLAVSKVSTVLWGLTRVAVAFVALAAGSPRSIIELVLGVAGFTTGIILGLFLLGSWRKPVSPLAALLGLLCGFAAVLVFWIGDLMGIDALRLAWPWYAPIGALTTAATGIVFDRLGIGYGPPAD